MEQTANRVKELMTLYEGEFIETFRHLHQYPEMSFKEYETTAYIKEKLTGWGIEILDIGLETGVVGYLKGGKEGPCIALRADIDGLPVKEESSYAFPSKNEGKMHACRTRYAHGVTSGSGAYSGGYEGADTGKRKIFVSAGRGD